mgnify:CR=1 FL=1
MLSFQDCVDMCDLTPEEERAIRENLTLAEIGQVLAACRDRNEQGQCCCVMLKKIRIGSESLGDGGRALAERTPACGKAAATLR